MARKPFPRIPEHIGCIPDGNRRWAEQRGQPRAAGYMAGIEPGLRMLDECLRLGIRELSIYGFTQDNTRRPKDQVQAFQAACVEYAAQAVRREISLRVIGDTTTPLFPAALLPYARERQGNGKLRVNLLVNYGWNWDFQVAAEGIARGDGAAAKPLARLLASADVPRIQLLLRWGGRRRLSGFLPVQSVYADFYVREELWPDFTLEQFHAGLHWYARQDVTLGG